MTVRAFVLLGGFFGPDGWVFSAPFRGIETQLTAIPGVTCETYTWNQYAAIEPRIKALPAATKVAVIGYSGGGWCAALLANMASKPRIDLMVCYDPSPKWKLGPQNSLNNTNVKRAITYQNSAPFFFGLGGGVLLGKQVERVFIAENHVTVQSDQSLHARTIAEIKKL